MRVALTESETRSYTLIWRTNRKRYRNISKTPGKPRNPGRAMLFRAMKLGDETLAKIVGTSLDNADELDELVKLNRGAPLGELTPVVVRLVNAAAAGQHVSAIVEATKMGGIIRRKPGQFELAANWKRRMIASWKLATPQERVELCEHLFAELSILERQLFIKHLRQPEGRTQ
jgi:hypothetical protein